MPEVTDKSLADEVKARRKEASHERWCQRFARWTQTALLAEAFLLALWPTGATIALLAGVVLLIIRFCIDKNFKFRHLPLDVPATLFAVIGAASILVSPDRNFSLYNYYNLVGVYVLTYVLAGQVLRERQQVKKLLAVSAVAAVLVIFYGFYQFVFGIDTASMKWVDGDAFPELKKRVFSTWENPNILAGYLDIVICMAFGLLVRSGSKEQRILMGVLMLSGAACLAMTYARGALLVIAIIIAVYGVFRDWRVLAGCAGVAFVALLADPVLYDRVLSVFTKVDTSMEMRMALWESTVAMIQDHPFLGIGWGAYYMVYPEYDFYLQGAPVLIVHAHNVYLNYAAEIGLPGMLAFCWFFFGTIWLAFSARFEAPNEPLLLPGPFTLSQGAADAELAEVVRSLEAQMPRQARQFWKLALYWPEQRLLSGCALGLGLALVSVALNGLTDDLLFNIPTSMLLWLMAALAGVLTLMQALPVEEGESGGSEN